MDRAARRRMGRAGTEGLAISKYQPLKVPQHWHVGVIWYATIDLNGNFQWASHFDVVASDLALALTYTRNRARELGGVPREQHHVDHVTMCADKEHLENLPEELLNEKAA